MIQLKKIECRNFFSAGDQPIGYSFDDVPLTLITGENGAGKSSLTLDAVCFALFGRAYRPVNKGNVINSINQKDCSVVLEFISNEVPYRIERGMKPNVLRVFRDGKMLDSPSNARDFQKEIETDILGFSFNSFKQVCVISAKNFTPFMRLSAAQRRELIEEILDLSVLSEMKRIVSDRLSAVKTEQAGKELERSSIEMRIMQLKDDVVEFEKLTSDENHEARQKIEEFENELHEENASLKRVVEKIQTLEGYEIRKKHSELQNRVVRLEEKRRSTEKISNFIMENDECPTCLQEINGGHKEKISQKAENGKEKIDASLSSLRTSLEKLSNGLKKLEELERERRKIDSRIHELNANISSWKKMLNASFDTAKTFELIDERNRQIRECTKNKEKLVLELENLARRKRIHESINGMLKDDGIRAEVIKKHLPSINQIVNEFLDEFGFDTTFVLDENFNEQILSRHRDNFTYENFSAGQQQKIDLALLFAWREISKRRNSISCNVLFLDEVADSSLDSESTDALLTILKKMSKTVNIFLVSHKSTVMMEESFQRILHFEIVGGFSTMEEQK